MSTTKTKVAKQDQKDNRHQQQKHQQQQTGLQAGTKKQNHVSKQVPAAILEHELPEMRMTD